MTTGIAVMAKAPRSGQCKTRLAPLLRPDESACMAGAFLSDVTANLALAASQAPITPYVAFAPAGAEAAFDGRLAHGTGLLLADGSAGAAPGVQGFGRCLLHAITALLGAGHDAACVLNADSPNLPTGLLLAAHTALTQPGDHVVMGPAEDGGYYLLGMKRPHAALFADIAWSTPHVAAQTRACAAQAGLKLVELDPWYDVDEPAALHRLLADLAAPGTSGAFAAPHTAACAARLGLAVPAPARSAQLAKHPRTAPLAGVRECL
jgi:rSAM/selenodomain-associated transferase 1